MAWNDNNDDDDDDADVQMRKYVSNLFDAKLSVGKTTTKWNILTANEAWKIKH